MQAEAQNNLTERQQRVKEVFRIPDAADPFIDFFLDAAEQDLIVRFGEDPFPAAELPEEVRALEYHRGILSKADAAGQTYRVNDFYGFLDVFCVSRKDEYDRLTMEEKRGLDDWYFDAYYDGLDTDSGFPTPDRVYPIEEMLDVIERDPRPIYLNYCDCRSLTGACGLPTRTCLTWKNGPNSFVDRGLSKPLTKEEAKEVIRQAEKAGLMHTTMGQSICNCCGDCCYLFRTRKRLRKQGKQRGTWPYADWIISLDGARCIGCGRCVKRCHLGVFSFSPDTGPGMQQNGDEKTGRSTGRHRVQADVSRCAGCGICTGTCPAGALRLERREQEERQT